MNGSGVPSATPGNWVAPLAWAPVNASCTLPGSKSQTNRALILASLADGPSKLSGVLAARDTELMLSALSGLGVAIDALPDGAGCYRVNIIPPERFHAPAQGIDCGLAGTVMRFIPPVAALAPGVTHFDGDPQARKRPMGQLISGLRQLGCTASADSLPFTLTAPRELAGQVVSIDAHESSQFISAFLLAGARYPQGLVLRHRGGPLPSLPHIQMTLDMLTARGVEVRHNGRDEWLINPGRIAALDQRIEPDLTNAAVFLAAGALTGGQVSVPGWPDQTTQPGDLIREILQRLGVQTVLRAGVLQVNGSGVFPAQDIDLHAASELTPVVAALLVFAEGRSIIRGVAHIRGHETDRLSALATELGSLGVDVTETADGLVINGIGGERNRLCPSRVLHAYGDHRMAHFAALIGLVVPGIELDDIASVSKTMPDFTARWATLLAEQPGNSRIDDTAGTVKTAGLGHHDLSQRPSGES